MTCGFPGTAHGASGYSLPASPHTEEGRRRFGALRLTGDGLRSSPGDEKRLCRIIGEFDSPIVVSGDPLTELLHALSIATTI